MDVFRLKNYLVSRRMEKQSVHGCIVYLFFVVNHNFEFTVQLTVRGGGVRAINHLIVKVQGEIKIEKNSTKRKKL